MQAEQRCKHGGCRCDGQPNYNGYCSTYCATARSQGKEGGGCDCGHRSCKLG